MWRLQSGAGAMVGGVLMAMMVVGMGMVVVVVVAVAVVVAAAVVGVVTMAVAVVVVTATVAVARLPVFLSRWDASQQRYSQFARKSTASRRS
jgi:hypothetical protein